MADNAPSPNGVPATDRRANIVGTGLIGGSIGLALRERGWRVHGTDTDAERVARAAELGAIDAIGVDPAAAITFVASPVGAVPAVAREMLASTAGVVTDVGSVKAPVVDAVSHARFVGGHPMAGSEQDGVDGARSDLFSGAVWVLTPVDGTDDEAYALVGSIAGSLGAEVVTMPPDRHDQLVAVVSHVPHLTAATLMGLAAGRSAEHRTLLRLAAGGFRDMTRIAAGHPGIWPDICVENRAAIVEVLDEFIASLSTVRSVVADRDRERLLAVLEQARVARRNLPTTAGRPRPADRDPGARTRSAGGDRRYRHHGERPGRHHLRPRDRPLGRGPPGRAGHDRRSSPGRAPGRRAHGHRLPAEPPGPRMTIRGMVPFAGPVDAVVALPGSKSITNRALVCAALAGGRSTLTGALVADDTEAMIGAVETLGAAVQRRSGSTTLVVDGVAGTSARRSAHDRRGPVRDHRSLSSPRCSGSVMGPTASMRRRRCGPGRWARCSLH